MVGLYEIIYNILIKSRTYNTFCYFANFPIIKTILDKVFYFCIKCLKKHGNIVAANITLRNEWVFNKRVPEQLICH